MDILTWDTTPTMLFPQIERQLQIIEIGSDNFSERVKKLSFNGK